MNGLSVYHNGELEVTCSEQKRRASRAALKLDREPAVPSTFQPLNKGGIVFSEQLESTEASQPKTYPDAVHVTWL